MKHRCIYCACISSTQCSHCRAILCGTQCFDAFHLANPLQCVEAPQSIGHWLDLENERKHRKTGGAFHLQKIVGPRTIYIKSLRDYKFQVWIFGESHVPKAQQAALGALDIQVEPDKRLTFMGNQESGSMEIARYMYAAASKAFRAQTKLDIFIERIQSHKANRKAFDPDVPTIRLQQMDQLFFPCLHDRAWKEWPCDFSPYVHFHAVDFRHVIEADLFECMQLLAIFMKTNPKLNDQVVEFLRQFETSCPEWSTRWLQHVFNSNDYVQTGFDTFGPPCKQLKIQLLDMWKKEKEPFDPELLRALNNMSLEGFQFSAKTIVENGSTKTMSRVKAQYWALAKQDLQLAQKIYWFMAKEMHRLSWEDSYSGYGNVKDIVNLIEQHAMIIRGRIMDSGVLFRLFRNFGEKHAAVKMVYAGEAHAELYRRFFASNEMVGNVLAISRGSGENVINMDKEDVAGDLSIFQNLINDNDD
jgi:hypothetical protein